MLAFLAGGRFLGAAADHIKTGNPHQRQNQQAIIDVAEQIAEPEAGGEQSPKRGIAPALAVGFIAHTAKCEARKHCPCQGIEPVKVDHFSRSSRRSSNSRRVPWMKKAQIALGIAQTESWKGVNSIPKLASEPWISRIEATARKISSPKN